MKFNFLRGIRILFFGLFNLRMAWTGPRLDLPLDSLILKTGPACILMVSIELELDTSQALNAKESSSLGRI